MALLSIDIKSRSFQSSTGELSVLKDIHLEVEKGEFICIVGPSGCGKTTFLNIVSGLDHDYEGKIVYKGEFIRRADPKMMLIFQDLGLFPWLSVSQNVEFGLKIKEIPKQEREKKVLEYLEMMQLLKFKDSFLHQLSGGMRQRVALARALVMEPEVLLMDEPFAALDAITRDILHEELQRIWSFTRKTVIFVTHNVREAVCLGDRVLDFSSNPASIKTQFTIDLARPRHIENEGLIARVRPILNELKEELERMENVHRI
jgi:NitT/TauT family transport system ATP-binding protein